MDLESSSVREHGGGVAASIALKHCSRRAAQLPVASALNPKP